MIRTLRMNIVAGVIAMTSLPAAAQELIVGLGYTQFSSDRSEDSALASVEYRHSPFYERGKFEVALAGAVVGHTEGDAFLGAGLSTRYAFNPKWFVELSVLPGAFLENDSENDLGSTFQIRSLLALGYNLKSGNRISVGLSHKSNAGTSDRNPGVNALSARWHFAF